MLVIISDLHLTDGTSGETINERAFRIFKNRIGDMAYDASWRAVPDDKDKDAEKYVPIDHIDIVLLGDIMDMIRSEQWNDVTDENCMPWTEDSPRKNEFYNKVEAIADGILDFNKASFEILRGLTDGDLTIPETMNKASDEEQRTLKIRYKANGKVKLKVNIFYMVGNHDWFFYVKDARMNAIRNKVIDALGLCNPKDTFFPSLPEEYADLKKVQDDHRVYALHGDEFDETNYTSPNRDSSSKGDVVVIRLLNQIPKKILKYMEQANIDPKRDDVKAFIQQMREIDNLRPYGLAASWITQAIKENKMNDGEVNDAIRLALREVIEEFVENRLVDQDLKLKLNLKMARLLLGHFFSIEILNTIVEHLSLNKDRFESYSDHAITMAKGVEKDFFIMGHTHYAEVVPLSSYMDSSGKKRSKIYMNTGTWRSMHKTGIEDGSFISYKTMTIAAFYKPDERKGRAFEYWTATLAL